MLWGSRDIVSNLTSNVYGINDFEKNLSASVFHILNRIMMHNKGLWKD